MYTKPETYTFRAIKQIGIEASKHRLMGNDQNIVFLAFKFHNDSLKTHSQIVVRLQAQSPKKKKKLISVIGTPLSAPVPHAAARRVCVAWMTQQLTSALENRCR